MGVGDVEGYEQQLNIHPRSSMNGSLPLTVPHQILRTLKGLHVIFLHSCCITTADRLCLVVIKDGHICWKDVAELLAPLPHEIHDLIEILRAFNQTLKLNETVNGITKYY